MTKVHTYRGVKIWKKLPERDSDGRIKHRGTIPVWVAEPSHLFHGWRRSEPMVGYTMKEAKEIIDRKLERLAKEKASVCTSCTSYESAEFGHVEITPEDKEKSA
mgnify:CR=1 FL=1